MFGPRLLLKECYFKTQKLVSFDHHNKDSFGQIPSTGDKFMEDHGWKCLLFDHLLIARDWIVSVQRRVYVIPCQGDTCSPLKENSGCNMPGAQCPQRITTSESSWGWAKLCLITMEYQGDILWAIIRGTNDVYSQKMSQPWWKRNLSISSPGKWQISEIHNSQLDHALRE